MFRFMPTLKLKCSQLLQFYLTAIALVCSQLSQGGELVGYTIHQTKQGIQISVPNNWRVYSSEQLQRHYSKAKEFSKQSSDHALASTLIFAAEASDRNGQRVAYASLIAYDYIPVTQYDVRQQTTELIAQVKADIYNELQPLIQKGVITEFKIIKARKVENNDLAAIEVEYQRTTKLVDKSRVRLYRFYDEERSFTFTFSHREDAAFSMIQVGNTMIASLRRR